MGGARLDFDDEDEFFDPDEEKASDFE